MNIQKNSEYLCSQQRNYESMLKNRLNTNKRDVVRAALIKKTAEIMGVSPRYVRMVLADTRKNDNVLYCFMELEERENLLLQEVKSLIPFN